MKYKETRFENNPEDYEVWINWACRPTTGEKMMTVMSYYGPGQHCYICLSTAEKALQLDYKDFGFDKYFIARPLDFD